MLPAELRRDPGVPDLKDLHAALERRAVSMDTDRKFQRTQEYAQRRVAEQQRQAAKMRGAGGSDAAAPVTSITGGKAPREKLNQEVANDAKDVAARLHYMREMNKVRTRAFGCVRG